MSSIEQIIAEVGGWRSDMLAHVRELILTAESGVVEETKWQKATNPLGVPTWSLQGLICTGETYKDKVKLTFAKGASLEDPDELFNSSLDANVRRAIDLHEGDTINATAFQTLVRAAVALNAA
ncbi:hypothetical protein E3O44_12145 [Cryobacterium algoricola]|uniref:YdhG-like domain-containing protein n=1 Tax=Cryobacterium algoricola TaxID=1259183 RepID=A0ABY2IAW0_9MICO|nr:DUF1801 domain-containing protein [Cryobacterium algoricola]TFB86206.1 hypothetical protein E3O44_12145 [Cryobacterium algoricola]